jgi:hypothetical protein
MHNQPGYLYKNVNVLYTDLAALKVGYRKMYARTLKLYKGIDNQFSLRLMNGDQKLIDVVGQTLYWMLMDRDTAEVKYMTSKTVEGGDNSLVTITIPESDLEAINSGHYTYSSYLADINGQKKILYGDSQYGASVAVEVINNSFPQVYPSQEVTEFLTSDILNYQQPDNSLYTSALNAYPEKNSNNSLHTASFYSTNFEGTVDIEASLENGITDIVNWSKLTSKAISNNQTICYINFYGVFNFVRFRVRPSMSNTGIVDKILYRS